MRELLKRRIEELRDGTAGWYTDDLFQPKMVVPDNIAPKNVQKWIDRWEKKHAHLIPCEGYIHMLDRELIDLFQTLCTRMARQR